MNTCILLDGQQFNLTYKVEKKLNNELIAEIEFEIDAQLIPQAPSQSADIQSNKLLALLYSLNILADNTIVVAAKIAPKSPYDIFHRYTGFHLHVASLDSLYELFRLMWANNMINFDNRIKLDNFYQRLMQEKYLNTTKPNITVARNLR